MIIDIKCDDGSVQIAKTIHENEDTYNVMFLEQVKKGLFDFNKEIEVVHKDSVSGFYDVECLEETGLYVPTPNGYELIDDSEDEDYECSDEEDADEDDDVSLVDEDLS
jgi:hypothetical protein